MCSLKQGKIEKYFSDTNLSLLRKSVLNDDKTGQARAARELLFGKQCLSYNNAHYLRSLLGERANKNLLLSIVIVTKNAESELIKTISSVKEHLAENRVEFIIFDGMSTDGTQSMIDSLEGVICIRDEDSGLYDAMNKASSIARGRFLFYLNSGDTLKVNNFNYILKVISSEEYRGRDLVYFSTECIDTNGNVWLFTPEPVETIWAGMAFSHQGCFISRKAFLENNQYDLSVGIASDYLLLNRLVKSGNYTELKDFCFCRTAPFGISLEYYQRTLNRMNVILKVYRDSDKISDYIAFYNLLLRMPFEVSSKRALKAFNRVKHDLRLASPEACEIIYSYAVKNKDISIFLDKKSNLVEIVNKSRKNSSYVVPKTSFDEGNLIFLISMPRSGSTLLQRLLMTSDRIRTTSEPWLMLNLLSAYSPNFTASFDSDIMRKANELFVYESGLASSCMYDSIKLSALNLYESAVNGSGRNSDFFLDKTPRYLHIIEHLMNVFPNSRYIVLNRNILDILCSYLSTWCNLEFDTFYSNSSFVNDFKDGLSGLALINERSRRCSNVLSLSYEDLVAEPDLRLLDIAYFLELNSYTFKSDYGTTMDRKFGFGDPKGVHKLSKPSINADSWKSGIKNSENLLKIQEFIKSIDDDIYCKLGNKSNDLNRLEELGKELSFTDFSCNDSK